MSHVGKSADLISRDQDFDPQSGYGYVETWQGTKDACEALQAGYALAGAKTTLFHKGSFYTLTVRLGLSPDGGGPETPTDHWEIDTEMAQESIYFNPKITGGSSLAPATLALYKKEIETAIKAGTALSGTDIPVRTALYNLVAQNAETHEVRRIVLSQVRTCSINYSSQIILTAVENIYTTAGLTAAFSIPAAISDRLPADPATHPTDTAWAWKMRRQNSRFILSANKVEEVRDWTFAAWSTKLYTLV